MAREKMKTAITSFTPNGDFLAVLLPIGIVKIWNTSNGSLLAEWKQSEGDSDVRFSCMACSFVGKKWKKDQGTCLVAVGTDSGDVSVINISSGATKWKSTGHHPGGIARLSFANKGHKLYVISTDGRACEMNSETGELIKETRASKRIITSSVFSCDDEILATASSKVRVLSLENGKELLKFSADTGAVQHMCISSSCKAIITSGFADKNLQVWRCEPSTRTVSTGSVLSMRHPPLGIECKNGCNGDENLIVLSVSESGVAYIWNLKASSEEDITPTKITVKADKTKTDPHGSERTRKSRTPIFAARIHSLYDDGRVTALVAYGSADSPKVTLLDISSPGEDIVIAATHDVPKNGVDAGKGLHMMELEPVAGTVRKEKKNKKRATSDSDSENAGTLLNNGREEPMDGVQTDDDLNEPTMGERLASLSMMNIDDGKSHEKAESSPRRKPPSADSVHVLLKQALHADDRALLLDCLYRQDEKIVANSVSLLNPSDVFKLLESLISIIHSRGAVVVCALPWLRSLLLQHASSILSHESSLLVLNSLYQLVESRVSTFNPALQLSSTLDLLCARTADDRIAKDGAMEPLVYEDKDESEGEGSEEDEAMETHEDKDEPQTFSDVSDLEEVM